MESTIRVSASAAPRPLSVGGAEYAIEVDLRDATGGDIAATLPAIAEAYRTAHYGERSAEGLIEVPFPEAGDPHPFPEEEPTPEPLSQPGTKKEQHARDVERVRHLVLSVLDSASLDDPTPITTHRIVSALEAEGLIR